MAKKDSGKSVLDLERPIRSCKAASCDAIVGTSQVLEPASESEIHWWTRSKRNFERQVVHYTEVFAVSGNNMQ